MNSKLLKGINYVSIAITIALTIFFFVNLFSNPLYRNDYTTIIGHFRFDHFNKNKSAKRHYAVCTVSIINIPRFCIATLATDEP
jgi:hypothetical protein